MASSGVLPLPSLLESARAHHVEAAEQSTAPSATKEDAVAAEAEEEVIKEAYSVFTNRHKWGIVLLVSTAGLFSGLGPGTESGTTWRAWKPPWWTTEANIYFPSIPAIALDLNVSIQQINLSVTWYMLLQGFSPTFWGSVCDVLGRRPIYLATFTLYIGACIGLALTHTYWLLVLLRCFQAAGSASVIAIGSGSIGDIAPPSERGGYMGAFSLGPMLGPCIGPVFGGILTQAFGWQSIFWFLAAFAGVVFLVMLAVLPETLRSIVGNGSIPAKGINRSLLSLFRARQHRNDLDHISIASVARPPKKTWRDIDLIAPFRLFAEKDVLLLLTFNSVVYTLFYCVITSTGTTFKDTYGLSELQLGLCFLANGAGCLVASFINGPRLDRDYRIVREQVERKQLARVEKGEKVEERRDVNDLSSFPIEHARLRSLPISFIVLVGSTIIYGWVLDKGIHLSVPLICQFFIGLTVTTQFNSISTLLVDLYPGQSASATAANNLYRCLMGAAGTAVIDPILSALGAGWTFTMLSLITVLFVPLILVEYKYGMRFRGERAARMERMAEKRREKVTS